MPVLGADRRDSSRPELDEALGALVAAEFVVEQDRYPEARYAFKHPLTQEVAYGSQLGERRAAGHAAVARGDRRPCIPSGWTSAPRSWPSTGRPPARRSRRRAGTRAPRPGRARPTRPRRCGMRAGAAELADGAAGPPETVELGLTAHLFSLEFGWRLGISHEEAQAIFNAAERIAASAGNVRACAILLALYGLIRGINDGQLHEGIALAREAIASPSSPARPTCTWRSRRSPTSSSRPATTARAWRSAIARSSLPTAMRRPAPAS